MPGQTTWLAIRLDPIDHWHTYWKFGGDSGEATRAVDGSCRPARQWGRSSGRFPSGPLLGSDLVTFTYEREVFLPMALTVPEDFDADVLQASTRIEWQVCDEICIPGRQTLPFRFRSAPPRSRFPLGRAFAETCSLLPTPEGQHELVAKFNDLDGKVNVMIAGEEALFTDIDEAWFFPTERRIMRYAPYREVMLDGGRVQISTEQHRRYDDTRNELEGLLSVRDDNGELRAFEPNATRSTAAWDHSIEVELLSETTNIVPGETIRWRSGSTRLSTGTPIGKWG